MRLLLRMNKKGFLGEAPVDLVSAILLVIILVGFGMIFTFSGIFAKHSRTLVLKEMELEADTMLYGLLRYDVDGKSMAEFLIMSLDDEKKLEENVKNAMKGVCRLQDDCYWELEILKDGDSYSIKPALLGQGDFSKEPSADFLLPVKGKRVVVRMIRYSGITDRIEAYPGSGFG